MDFKQQAHDIINGKSEAPNQLVEFLVKRTIESRDEGNSLLSKIKETERVLGVMRRRTQELQGAVNSYFEDIETWLSKEAALDAEAVDDSANKGKSNGESKPFTDEERKALLDGKEDPKIPAP